MSFEKFQNRHTRLEERITITKSSNSIGFPSHFYHENRIKDFKYAVLFWDAADNAIGIHFTNDESEKKNAFLIARSKEGYGGSISAKSFFRHYKIDPKIYHGRYEWKKRTEDGVGELFVFALKARS
jgi:hypothetical protein